MLKLSLSSAAVAGVLALFLVILAAAPGAQARSIQGADAGAGEDLTAADELLLSRFLQEPRQQKRSMRRPPDDPRSLFAAIYGYTKRNRNPAPAVEAPVVSPYMANPFVSKRRGLRDPFDPRNLFRAIYGYKK